MRLSTSLLVVGAVVRGFAPVGVARPAVGRLGASKDEEAIGKQAKGFYIRPSAAIERGGGFFVPGLEGTKLRVANLDYASCDLQAAEAQVTRDPSRASETRK